MGHGKNTGHLLFLEQRSAEHLLSNMCMRCCFFALSFPFAFSLYTPFLQLCLSSLFRPFVRLSFVSSMSVPELLPSGIAHELCPDGVAKMFRVRLPPGQGTSPSRLASFFFFFGVCLGVRRYGYYDTYAKAKAKLDEVLALREYVSVFSFSFPLLFLLLVAGTILQKLCKNWARCSRWAFFWMVMVNAMIDACLSC